MSEWVGRVGEKLRVDARERGCPLCVRAFVNCVRMRVLNFVHACVNCVRARMHLSLHVCGRPLDADFGDEGFPVKHDKEGVVTMASEGASHLLDAAKLTSNIRVADIDTRSCRNQWLPCESLVKDCMQRQIAWCVQARRKGASS